MNDGVAPFVIDMLKNNSTLLEFDLTDNKSLKSVRKESTRIRWAWAQGRRTERTIPRRDGGKFEIVRGALFDTTSFEAIANCNHTAALKMTGRNHGDSYEETIRQVITRSIFALHLFIRTFTHCLPSLPYRNRRSMLLT